MSSFALASVLVEDILLIRNDILSWTSDPGASIGVSLFSAAATKVSIFKADPNLVEVAPRDGRTKPGEEDDIDEALTGLCNLLPLEVSAGIITEDFPREANGGFISVDEPTEVLWESSRELSRLCWSCIDKCCCPGCMMLEPLSFTWPNVACAELWLLITAEAWVVPSTSVRPEDILTRACSMKATISECVLRKMGNLQNVIAILRPLNKTIHKLLQCQTSKHKHFRICRLAQWGYFLPITTLIWCKMLSRLWMCCRVGSCWMLQRLPVTRVCCWMLCWSAATGISDWIVAITSCWVCFVEVTKWLIVSLHCLWWSVFFLFWSLQVYSRHVNLA